METNTYTFLEYKVHLYIPKFPYKSTIFTTRIHKTFIFYFLDFQRAKGLE